MENIILVQALADLAYSIAIVDGNFEEKEKEAFYEIIESEFGNDASAAIDRFNILQNQENLSVNQCYNFAMFSIKSNKADFTPKLKDKYLKVMERIASSSDGLRDQEKKMIKRFKKDLEHIY